MFWINNKFSGILWHILHTLNFDDFVDKILLLKIITCNLEETPFVSCSLVPSFLIKRAYWLNN